MKKGKDLKPHIGIFGRRNNGKSSLINTLVNQDVSIVSDSPGTTTDPVKKSFEIFGIGPSIIIDTAGIDDEGALGEKRVKKTLEVIQSIDCAIIVITNNLFGEVEKHLISLLRKHEVPFLIIHNKQDIEPLNEKLSNLIFKTYGIKPISFSTVNPINTDEVITGIKKTIPATAYQEVSLLKGLVKEKDYVLLVTPIDSEAPEARMILPQVMAIRDVLDNNCICIVLKETELEHFFLTSQIRPALVVTDSQAFSKVSKLVPSDIPLTGFSILFARLKGDFNRMIEGAYNIAKLKDGDKVLILESCSHVVSCEDIGRVKIPKLIVNFTGKNLKFLVVSGTDNINEPIENFALVIQCGGCVATRKQVLNRLKPGIDNNIPLTNYGMALAFLNGILTRALEPFQKIDTL
ncbi:MAG: [FeFe] hydrogenase H-cluster maturation GTPase HydF [Bacteroidetes bacterium]|nr:[FeFe] hydrogenase H-cluster maturation GTPase HydF [Bacteroidota bacterium]